MLVWLCNVQAFEQDLDKCEKGVAAIQKAARDIIEKSAEDVSKYQDQLVDLQTKWDKVCRLSRQKSERLDQAMGEAESFERKTYALLNWLRDAERTGAVGVADLHVGAVADLKFSLKNEKAFEHKPSGKYRLIEVVHHLDAKGHYKNSFKGIPADAPMLPASDIKRPVADAQPAVVVENHDPDGLGRVQVKFLWQKGDVFTPFLRVLRPDFGMDDQKGQIGRAHV